MKVIYIAGKYRSETEFGLVQNIRAAEAIALKVWKVGAVAICPHKNTAFFGGECDDSVWLNGDLELVRRSDAVLCVDNWEDSEGAKEEVAYAKSIDIPVFETFGDFYIWMNTRK